ncbi:hypothetical protein [Kingella oralis]
MERRRLAAQWRITQGMTGLPRCRRAADAPSVKISGCLIGWAKASA